VVEPWSIAIFELLAMLLILLCSIKAVSEKSLGLQLPAEGLPLVAFWLLGVLHCIAFTNGAGEVRGLSADLEATRKTVLLLFFLLACWLIATNTFTTRKRLQLLANFLVAYGLAMAMFALVQFFTWNGRFYWLRPNRQGMSPFGPFVSHNHFAGYMEMLIPLALVLALRRGIQLEARLFYGFAALMMGTASVASLSRGGLISLAAMLVFIGLCKLMIGSAASGRAAQRSDRTAELAGLRRHSQVTAVPPRARLLKGAGLVLGLGAAILLAILWVGPDRLAGRVSSGAPSAAGGETFFTSRGWIWRDSWAMIKANPLFGVGIGAFETAYPQYSHSDGSIVVGQSHNDYLQVLADAGIIGGLIALWFMGAIFRAVFRAVKSRDALLSAIALGSGAGIFAILVHSLFDFNLQLPSNILLFLILVAMVSQALILVRTHEADSSQPEPSARLSPIAKGALL
jgi:O-antigen ligase